MSAESEVRRRIQERGKITFAEFMDIALYWPQGGYYTTREPVGAVGDYYTSPAVHPAFGALLSVQLYQMWRLMDRPAPFTVLELGAGNGLLCRDIVTYSTGLPEGFAASLQYISLDRRPVTSVEPTTAEHRTPMTNRVLSDGVPFRGLQGCVLSNEYLDAFPVHQVVMAGDGLKEIYVGLEREDLVEWTGEPSDPGLADRLDGLGITLAEGQTAEMNLALDRYSQDVAEALDRGFVLTIDYGRTAQDLYDPEQRLRGTLVTYHQHVQTDSPLTRIGRQDITAQVDFTSVARAGENAGLDTLGLVTQRDFLSNLNLDLLRAKLAAQQLSAHQLRANRAGLIDLVRPGGLGDFKVLAQLKNVAGVHLWGLEGPADTSEMQGLAVPRLTKDHLSLVDNRHGGAETEFEALWPPANPNTETDQYPQYP